MDEQTEAWLLRHGSTEWTHSGRHAGRQELALDEAGRDEARAAGRVLLIEDHCPAAAAQRRQSR
jgi:broad specificity phosphatase PhoE